MSMKTSLGIALMLVCGASAQQVRIGTIAKLKTSGTLSNGIRLEINSDFTGVMQSAQGIEMAGAFTEGQVHHRWFIIGEHYLGYDLEVERIEGTNKFRFYIQPLSLDWDVCSRGRVGPKTPAPLPTYPPPQEIEQGDRILLDVAVDPITGRKATEEIQILSVEAPSKIEPRDLQLDDLAILGLRSPTLLEDGKTVGTTSITGTDRILALSVPGRGWIYLSIRSHEGYNFQKAGTIDGSRARFTAGGHEYELRSRDYILPRGGPKVNLYVLLDQQAPPTKGSFYGTRGATNGLAGQTIQPPQAIKTFEFRGGSAKQMLPRR
jgi:hypothetical protein